jgi:hypothetical protein
MRILQGLNVFLNSMMGKLGDNDSDFVNQIQWVCRANSWELSAVDDRRAVLPFRMGAAPSTCVLITNGSPFQAMLVFGSLTFPRRSAPDQLSTALMGRSAGLNIGHWLVITGDDEITYTCRESFNLPGMSPPAFRALAEALLDECDCVERIARSRGIIR